MQNISGFGTSVTVIATQSFPLGFNITQFADDTDPIAVDPTEPNGFELLYDGSLFAFGKAAPIKLSVSVIPGSDDDINLKILLAANKSASSYIPLPDITSMVISYADGGRVVLSNGTILNGPLADAIAPTGRRKSNTFTFVFGEFAGVQSVRQLIGGLVNTGLSGGFS
jgi:hypothetical protein